MSSAAKKKNESPASHYLEERPKDKVPAGNKAVKKAEDKDYDRKEPVFKNPAKKREESEQPVHPIKKAPKD